jgi:hypothetical protein
MDFVSRHPALKRAGPEAERLAEVYQQLGLAWEFLALQCHHRSGWRKTCEAKVSVEVRKHKRGEMPPYSHFVWELPRKLLRHFPVILQFDKRRRFTGLAIFKPQNKLPRGRQRP